MKELDKENASETLKGDISDVNGLEKGAGKSVNDDDSSCSSQNHSKYVWLHAFYHSIVTIIGTGILGFPYAISYLGWYGGESYWTGMSFLIFASVKARWTKNSINISRVSFSTDNFVNTGAIFITGISAYCYYTALLLIGLQETG